MRKRVVLMAAGSSGGHIYPALAIAARLESLFSKSGLRPSERPQAESLNKKAREPLNQDKFLLEIHLVHSGASLGKQILSSFKYPVHEIQIGGLAQGQSFLRRLRTILQLPIAFIKSLRLIGKIKADVVFGTGGAVSGLVLAAALLRRRKTALWEGNASPGLANKWLAPFVSCVFSVFPEVKKSFFKSHIVCGYPLRESFEEQNFSSSRSSGLAAASQEKFSAAPAPGKEELFKVLVLGGSQGSKLINEAVLRAAAELEWRKGLYIYHQTGKSSFESIKEKYSSFEGAQAFAFSLNLNEYYRKCDLIVSRAGSGAAAEAAAYGKALVLIPLAHSAGGHQLQNALALSNKKAVEVILEKDFNAESFREKVIELKRDKVKREQMGRALKNFYSRNGAARIAGWIYDSFTK